MLTGQKHELREQEEIFIPLDLFLLLGRFLFSLHRVREDHLLKTTDSIQRKM